MKNKNFWILLLLLLSGIVLGRNCVWRFSGGGDQKHQPAVLAEFRTVLRLRHSARTESRGTGHHLWTDHSHYHGQYYWRGNCAFDLSLSVTGLYGGE